MPLSDGPQVAIRCDTQDWPGCTLLAQISWVCTREGRQVRLCNHCDQAWKGHAKGNPTLMVCCPNCSKSIPEAMLPQTSDGYIGLLGAYYGHAFDRAMHRAGILKPIRETVLKILNTDMSIWADAEKAHPIESTLADADASG